MKVLWFVNRATPHRSPALDRLNGMGVEVLAVYREAGDGGRGWGAHEVAHPTRTLSGNWIHRIASLWSLAKTFDPDIAVIMGYSTLDHVAMWVIARLQRWRLVTRSDSNILDHRLNSPGKRLVKRLFIRLLIPRGVTVFTIGAKNAEYWTALGYDKQFLVPYRAAPFPCETTVPVQALSGQVDVARSVHLMFVGRLAPEKGILELLEAYQLLKHALSEREMRLTVVGDGPLAAQVVEWSERDPSVSYQGALPRERVGVLMRSASLVVLPSKKEPWNLVVNEAISLGVPVACSTVTGAGYDLPVVKNDLSTTPEQLALDLAAILRDGTIDRPTPVPDETASLLYAGLQEVANE